MVRLADNVRMNNSQESSRYRPEHLVVQRGQLAKVIGLTWKTSGDGGFVRMNIHSRTDS